MATKKTISDSSPVAQNDSPVAPDLSKFETALREIANGDAMTKNDYSIQIARKALGLD